MVGSYDVPMAAVAPIAADTGWQDPSPASAHYGVNAGAPPHTARTGAGTGQTKHGRRSSEPPPPLGSPFAPPSSYPAAARFEVGPAAWGPHSDEPVPARAPVHEQTFLITADIRN
jgi:hypothetical protein